MNQYISRLKKKGDSVVLACNISQRRRKLAEEVCVLPHLHTGIYIKTREIASSHVSVSVCF